MAELMCLESGEALESNSFSGALAVARWPFNHAVAAADDP